ncbi:MAG: hypothetical protein MJ248_04840 [Bacilli bacterium]|nr:hypothetical protein [Bacilli bacterium]
MKKTLLMFSSLAVVAIGVAALAKSPVSAKADYTNPDYTNIPALREVSSDSYITPIWSSQVGARRIDEKKVLVHDLGGWGYRAQLPGRKIDIASFHIKLDLEGMSNNNALMLIFGSAAGSYATEPTKMLTMDIVKAQNSNNLYQTTVSTTVHNTSIASYTDGQKWADDANYTGVQAEAENNKVEITVKKDNTVTSTITVNGVATTVQNSELYEKCVDGTQAYFALGFVNQNYGEQTYIVEELGDDSDKLYMSAAGDFGKVKTAISSLKAVDFETASMEDVLAAKATFENMPYSKLYSYDKNFFKADYDALKTVIDEAVAHYGASVNLQLLEQKVAALEALDGQMTTTEKIDQALALKNEASDIIIELTGQSMSAAQTTTYNGLVSRYEAVTAKIVPAIKALYEEKLSAYETAVNTPFANGSEYLAANNLKAAIPTGYNQYLSDSEVEAFAARINAANTKAQAQVRITHDNWLQGAGADIVKRSDDTIDLVSHGGYEGEAARTSGMYLKETVSVRDFEMVFSIDRVSATTGSWVSIGVMEKPAPFINAEDSSVQNNKGIFFLINRVNSQTLGVQAFIMTMTCNRLYDAPLTQHLEIPMATELKLSFKEVNKTIAGVSGTYFEMKFNNTGFDQETISVNKIKTALETREGHLNILSSGTSLSDPAIIHVKSINGFAPLAPSVKKTIEVAAPTSTDTEKEFEEGKTSGTVVFNLDTHNESLKSVTVNGEKLASTNYSYANNKLTLKNAYLKTLAAGDYTVIATTDGGSVTWTLHVIGQGGPTDDSQGGNEEQPTKKGCGGSIVAASAILSVISLAGIAFASFKKKEQ